VTISVRGTLNPALKPSESELATFPVREAAYFGNIFSQPPQYLGCLPPGVTEDPRVCGPSTSDCLIQFGGTCDQVCYGPAADGSYTACRGLADVPSDEGSPFVEGVTTKAYIGTITVFLE
jgi:hypothetical protein